MSGIKGLFTNIRDLMKFSTSFRWGFIVLVFVFIMAGLSWFSPYEEDHRRDTPRSKPPLTEISIGRDEAGDRIYARTLLGTTSQGQDVFWQLTYAIRNTFIIAGTAVAIGRGIAVVMGMLTGYIGGMFDRIFSTVVDSLIVLPRLPLLILIASILRGDLTTLGLGMLLGIMDWAHPSKRYRAQVLSLREREFTHTAVFSGMNAVKVVIREHLPFLVPFLLADVVSGFLWAIGMEVTLAYLGLGQLSVPSIGSMLYWGNYYNALLVNENWVLIPAVVAATFTVVGFYMLSLGITHYLDPRTRLTRLGVSDS